MRDINYNHYNIVLRTRKTKDINYNNYNIDFKV